MGRVSWKIRHDESCHGTGRIPVSGEVGVWDRGDGKRRVIVVWEKSRSEWKRTCST